MKILAIVNSRCLGRLRQKKAKGLLDTIKNRLGAEIALAEHQGHACDIARNISKDFDGIISAGGDGTFFEIINSLDFCKYKFGLLPIGAGNSLACELGITTPEIALQKIEKAGTKEVDVINVCFNRFGKEANMYFSATAGIGFFADVAQKASRYFKRMGGFCYPTATLFGSFSRKIIRAKISLDGAGFNDIDFTDLLVNNTSHISYLRVFKEAKPADGRFNIWFSKMNTLEQLLWNLAIITGAQFYYPGAKSALNKMSIRLPKPCSMMLDGEFFDSVSSADFSISDKNISVFC